jgi:signal transduction histidine kinase
MYKTTNCKLSEIYDREELQKLCDSFNEVNGTVIGILDLEGNIFIQSGYLSICTEFHRKNKITEKRCIESDSIIASKLEKGAKYKLYKCKNGLIDVAVPIVVDGQHIGNLFTGQFLLEKPDREFFIKQSEKYNFNKEDYLQALDNVPIYDEEYIRSTISFLVTLTEVIGNIGYKNLKIKNYTNQLENDKNDLQRMNLKLEHAKTRAEKSDRLKTQFLQNISHEIRTPINAIKGFSHILSTKKLDDVKRIKYRDIIVENSEQLINVVEDIVTISRIETSQLNIYNRKINVMDLIQEIESIYKETKIKNFLELRFLKDNQSCYADIFSDKDKIKQALVKVLDNAIKFTKQGFVELSCAIKNNQIEFCIKDSGIGISKSDQQRIFERFSKINSQELGYKYGTGLGLSISKGCVDSLGGKIWLESEVGKGSSFYISIPHNRPELSTQKAVWFIATLFFYLAYCLLF